MNKVGNIVIAGEPGVGKEYTARKIHKLLNPAGNFLVIDLEAGHFSVSPFVRKAFEAGDTLFLRRFDLLNQPDRSKWLRWINKLTNEHAQIDALLEDRGGNYLPDPLASLRVFGQSLSLPVYRGSQRRIDHNLVICSYFDNNDSERSDEKKLFKRLFPLKITLLPLRKRRQEISALSAHLLALHARRLQIPSLRFSQAAQWLLRIYSWPGNIDELDQVVHSAIDLVFDTIQPRFDSSFNGRYKPSYGYYRGTWAAPNACNNGRTVQKNQTIPVSALAPHLRAFTVSRNCHPIPERASREFQCSGKTNFSERGRTNRISCPNEFCRSDNCELDPEVNQ